MGFCLYLLSIRKSSVDDKHFILLISLVTSAFQILEATIIKEVVVNMVQCLEYPVIDIAKQVTILLIAQSKHKVLESLVCFSFTLWGANLDRSSQGSHRRMKASSRSLRRPSAPIFLFGMISTKWRLQGMPSRMLHRML